MSSASDSLPGITTYPLVSHESSLSLAYLPLICVLRLVVSRQEPVAIACLYPSDFQILKKLRSKPGAKFHTTPRVKFFIHHSKLLA